MKTITFKNGKILKIAQKTANIIKDRILGGCDDFQIFTDQNGLFLLINVSEIVCIE